MDELRTDETVCDTRVGETRALSKGVTRADGAALLSEGSRPEIAKALGICRQHQRVLSTSRWV
jgi:hypothetical protein